ncbi:MAG: Crp/Fnr family transcriptional regulator [Halomonadaceae bacterium]|nr:MAG: Crp/Fnr family transcriptional regulator [Halomonadaceae bacterium]
MNGFAQVQSINLKPTFITERYKSSHRSDTRLLRRNQYLIHEGDLVERACIVVSGALKSHINYCNGDSQVLGFHIPGDIIGHEALIHGPAFCSVIALDTSCVQFLDVSDAATSEILIENMHNEIQRLTRQLHLERDYSTSARLATFLLDYSQSQVESGYSRYEFILPMGRRDLAGYLGLAVETLSRVFSRFRDQGVLSVNTNHVHILDPERLEAAVSL